MITLLPKMQWLAQRRRPRGVVDVDDLVQAGALAALRATKTWRKRKGLNLRDYSLNRAGYGMVDELRAVDHISRLYRTRGHIDGKPLPALHSLFTSHTDDVPTQLAAPLGATALDAAANEEMWRQVRACLPERHTVVVELYFRRERTLRQIGDELGISESGACVLLKKSLQRLRLRMPRERNAE